MENKNQKTGLTVGDENPANRTSTKMESTYGEQTIQCSICHKEKPVEEGCMIAISANKDRCKECQDKMQEDCRKREKIKELLSRGQDDEAEKLVNETRCKCITVDLKSTEHRTDGLTEVYECSVCKKQTKYEYKLLEVRDL